MLGGELRVLAAAPPTPERMTAVLAQVHEVIRSADDLDIDPALAACMQFSLAGPHLAPGSQSAAPPPMTLFAFGMKSPDRRLPSAHRIAPYSPSRPDTHFKPLMRTG